MKSARLVTKLLSALLASAMLLPFAAGCGPKDGGEPSGTGDVTGAGSTAAPDETGAENPGGEGATAMYQGKTEVTELPELSVKSPDGQTEVNVWISKKGALYYSVTAKGKTVIECSSLGMAARGGSLVNNLSVVEGTAAKREINETYKMVTGPAAEAEDHCMESRFTVKNDSGSCDIVIRAFDDGIALRYENVRIGDDDEITVSDERTEVVLPSGSSTWGFEPTGTYEGEFTKRTMAQLASFAGRLCTPVLANSGDFWMLFTEAAVLNNNGDFCASTLESKQGSAVLNWSFGVDRDNNDKGALGELGRPGHFNITSVKTRNGFSTPWRVAVISDDTAKLALSTIVTDLNPDPDLELYADTSYIKPGRVAWSWWAEEGEQGNYDKHVEYIDFAAENGWEYVCLDANWRAFEGRLSNLCKYAKEKGVGIFVWVNYLDLMNERSMETLISKWAKAGVVGLKTDYFESDAQNVLEVMKNTAVCAAENKLMVLFHGCVIPFGEQRTYPNVVSYEAVQGEENHKWSAVPTIANCLMYPFTRNVCGPMDYTPVAMRMPANDSTTCFELAMPVVYESGLQHLAHAASVYKTYAGLSFLNNLKVQWDESKMLEGVPGEYVTMARRAGEDWYIGSMTLKSRAPKVTLDFLGDGEYNAYIYEDSEDGRSLVISEKKVKKGDTLEIHDLLDRGGVAVLITKKTVDTKVEAAEQNDPGFTYIEAEDSKNKLSGDARISNAPLCSEMKNVGYIGQGAGNTLTVKVNVESAGVHKLRIWYCSAETRSLTLSVNGGIVTVSGLNSGSWSRPAMKEVEVELAAGENTIVFSNSAAYAPDIDKIAVSVDKVG